MLIFSLEQSNYVDDEAYLCKSLLVSLLLKKNNVKIRSIDWKTK
jgi:hypothetical protein